MDSNWTYLYKFIDGKNIYTTNLLYTPLISPDQSIMCMSWDSTSEYHSYRLPSEELLDFFFEREVKFLKKFQRYDWAPKILDINEYSKKIYIEWNKESLNHIICGGRDLNQECPTWKEQIFNMLSDIKNEGCYKAALYPHCFFIGEDNKLKTLDFYSCADVADPYVEIDTIKGMIGDQSVERFAAATENGLLDIGKFFKITMLTHLGKTWTDNPFPDFYKRLYD